MYLIIILPVVVAMYYTRIATYLQDSHEEEEEQRNSAIVLGFNLPGIKNLVLSREHIVGIYNGTFTHWNNASIKELNPRITLPEQKIIVIARWDSSGTTEVFTHALSAFDENWRTTYGTFNGGLDSKGQPLHWKSNVVKKYGLTNHAISGMVLSYRYSVGYLSIAEAALAKVNYIGVLNSAGQVVNATAKSVQSAMNDFADKLSKRLTTLIVDPQGPESYPISTYTYFVVSMSKMTECRSAEELVRYIEWFMYDSLPRRQLVSLNMVPLDDSVRDIVFQRVIKQMTCNGKTVYDMVMQMKYAEISLPTWQTPVFVFVSLCSTLLIGWLLFQTIHKFRLYNAFINNEWKIDPSGITVTNSTTHPQLNNESQQLQRVFIDRSAIPLTSKKLAKDKPDNVHVLAGHWGDLAVTLTSVNIPSISLQTSTKKRLIRLRNLVQNENILRFYGLCPIGEIVYAVHDYNKNGALKDILRHSKYTMTGNFMISVSSDIAVGMAYLHGLAIIHGCLKAECCFVDATWKVKVARWTDHTIVSNKNNSILAHAGTCSQEHGSTGGQWASDGFWIAPELLKDIENTIPTCASDVYSFAMVMQEIFTRDDPFREYRSVLYLDKIMTAILKTDMRPKFHPKTPPDVREIMGIAWSKDPYKRPSMQHMLDVLISNNPKKQNVMDCMMDTFENHALQMEQGIKDKIKQQNAAIASIKDMMISKFPPPIGNALITGNFVKLQSYTSTTVMTCLLPDFHYISADMSPSVVTELLTKYIDCVDDLLDVSGVYCLPDSPLYRTVIAGLSPTQPGSKDHAVVIAELALQWEQIADDILLPGEATQTLHLQIGICSGQLAAGVIGSTEPYFCSFGPPIEVANDLAWQALRGSILLTKSVHERIRNIDTFSTKYNGEIELKHLGNVEIFQLLRQSAMPPVQECHFSRRESDSENMHM